MSELPRHADDLAAVPTEYEIHCFPPDRPGHHETRVLVWYVGYAIDGLKQWRVSRYPTQYLTADGTWIQVTDTTQDTRHNLSAAMRLAKTACLALGQAWLEREGTNDTNT